MNTRTTKWNRTQLINGLLANGAQYPYDLPGDMPVAGAVLPVFNVEGYDTIERLKQDVVTGTTIDAINTYLHTFTALHRVYALSASITVTTASGGTAVIQPVIIPTANSPFANAIILDDIYTLICTSINYSKSIDINLILPQWATFGWRVIAAATAGSRATMVLNYLDVEET